MKFKDICQQAPQLAELKKQAKNWTDNDEARLYPSFKSIISSWVGWDARRGLPDWMYTSEAYDIAIKAIVYGRNDV